jgi:isocitrate dehydrogenase
LSEKIKVQKPLVVLHGDEMAQVAFTEILARFVSLPLDIELVEIDLSAPKRFTSNGHVIHEAIAALKEHGVGIKNAGMTVNRAQLDDLLAKYPEITESSLDPLATKSPNGAIRKGISGNITREDIEFRNLKSVRPDWIDRDIEVDTMETGGLDFSYSELSNATGVAKVMFVGSSGDPVELHRRSLNKGDPWMLATNDLDEVKAWAHRFFQRAIAESRDIYLGLKDTVVSGYDGVMRAAIEDIYEQEYKEQVAAAGLNYHYELIDAQAARIVSNPPERALWGVPDNVSGMKLFKLVQQLKRYGLPERKAHVSISRMSAGGGDQYGSYNTPAPEQGVIKVIVDGEEKHARHVEEGDPILFMSNDREAIKDWVSQVFQDALDHASRAGAPSVLQKASSHTGRHDHRLKQQRSRRQYHSRGRWHWMGHRPRTARPWRWHRPRRQHLQWTSNGQRRTAANLLRLRFILHRRNRAFQASKRGQPLDGQPERWLADGRSLRLVWH